MAALGSPTLPPRRTTGQPCSLWLCSSPACSQLWAEGLAAKIVSASTKAALATARRRWRRVGSELR